MNSSRIGPYVKQLSKHSLLLILCLIALESGCTLKSREAIIYHALDYPSPDKQFKAPVRDTLMIYHFLLDDAVKTDSVVVAESGEQEYPARRHRWHENPADMITELVMRDLENSGLFQKTIDQSSSTSYRYALEGTIKKFWGTISGGKAAALLEADVTLTDFDPPPGKTKNVFSKTYRIEVPSKDTSPNSIVKALNETTKQLSESLRGDLREVMAPARPPGGRTKRSS